MRSQVPAVARLAHVPSFSVCRTERLTERDPTQGPFHMNYHKGPRHNRQHQRLSCQMSTNLLGQWSGSVLEPLLLDHLTHPAVTSRKLPCLSR